MARHPTARRVRRTATEPDDAFVARLLALSTWAQKHARLLTIGTVVVALGIIVGLYYRNFQATTRARAEAELLGVRQAVSTGNTQVAIRELQDFLTTYAGTPSATEARLLLAQSLLQEGQPQQAIEAVQPLAGDLDDLMGVSAAFLLGAAHEANGAPAEAERVYLRIADEAEFAYQRQDALDAAARVRMASGRPDQAAELYERLVGLVPAGSLERGHFEMRLAEARAAAND